MELGDLYAGHLEEIRRRHDEALEQTRFDCAAVFSGAERFAFLDDRGHVVLAAAYGGPRIDTFFPPWPNPPEIVTLDAHWLADLTVRYQASPAISLFARVANLLDTEYEQVYGYQMPGRTVYAGVTAQFAR